METTTNTKVMCKLCKKPMREVLSFSTYGQYKFKACPCCHYETKHIRLHTKTELDEVSLCLASYIG